MRHSALPVPVPENQATPSAVTFLGLALLALACLAPDAAAQRSDSLVRADMEFAQGLAERYRYVDLAEDVLHDIDAGGVGEGLTEELALVKCDVYAEGAKYEGDPERRVELYDKAVRSYRSFLDSYPFSELLTEAQRAYVDVANRFARVLEAGLEDQVGEEREATRAKIKDVLGGALDLTADLIDPLQEIDEPTRAEQNELYRLMLNRGQMLSTQAQVSEQGTFYFSQATDVLTSLALRAGEDSAAGLQAYLVLSQVKIAEGEYGEAADFSAYVCNTAVPFDPELRSGSDAWLGLPFEVRQQRWTMVELGMKDLLQALEIQGDNQAATEWALGYYNLWKSEGFSLSPLGYLSLLGVARALLDAGGYVGGALGDGDLTWFETHEKMQAAGFSSTRNARSALDLAISIAQEVNDENRGSTLQVRAQKLISEAIDRPGVVVSPGVLFEAAEGEFYAKEYVRSLESFRRMLHALDRQDAAARKEYMPKVLFRMGAALDRLDRPLEAAMAHREAATNWKGDPEFQERNARGYWEAMKAVKRKTGDDPEITKLSLEAENLQLEAAREGGTGDILWQRGNRAYEQQDYDAARQAFRDVGEGEDTYEKALVKAVLCLYKEGKTDEATEAFTKYLEEFVPNPAHAITTTAKQQARREASAMATYYLGIMAQKEGDHRAVDRWLADYSEKFPGQDNYAVAAFQARIRSLLERDDLDGARVAFGAMRDQFPEHPRTGVAGLEVFKGLSAAREAAEAAGKTDEARALKAKMADVLSLANSLASSASFPNLRRESSLWVELGEWTHAEAALRRLVDEFASDPERTAELERYVYPDLGLVLLRQKRVPEAFEVLDHLVPDPDDEADKRKPSSDTVMNWCRAVCGWVEGDEDDIVEVPGVGGEEHFADAAKYWGKLWEAQEKWTCDYYRVVFETAYSYYRWGQVQSDKLQSANGMLTRLRTDVGDPQMGKVSEVCGDDVVRLRLLWLWGKLQ